MSWWTNQKTYDKLNQHEADIRWHTKELEELKKDITFLKESIKSLITQEKPSISFQKLENRLDALEQWKAQIQALFVEKTQMGKDKLSKIGRTIFDRMQQ